MTRQVTIEDVLPPVLTNVLTNTAIASAGIATLGPITVQVPNLVAGQVLSCVVEVWWRDAFAATANVGIQRVGVRINGAAVNNLDFAYTAIGNTGDPEANCITRDITALLAAVAGPTFTLEVQFAMQTTVNQAINNIQGKVYLTYAFDETVAITSFPQTITLPIQGDVTTIPTAGTYVQIGTTGTGPAPANQIPQLTGVGGILTNYGAALIIDRIWIEVYGQDAGAAATNFNATYRFDGAGPTYARATLVQTLNGSTNYVDFFDITSAGLATTVAHAFEVTTSLNARFSNLCALLKIQIRFNPTAVDYTKHLNSIRLPISPEGFGTYPASTATGDRDVVSRDLWIEEPGTIVLRQSGVFLWVGSTAGATLNLSTPQNNTARPFVMGALTLSGPFALCVRGNIGATPWTLARGRNTLSIGAFTTGSTVAVILGGWMYICYESDVYTVSSVKRPWDHNHSLMYSIQNAPTSGALPTRRAITSGYQTPSIASPWFLNAWACQQFSRVVSANFLSLVRYEVLVGEQLGEGWAVQTIPSIVSAELGFNPAIFNYTEFGRQNSLRNDGLNPTATRNFQLTTLVASATSYLQWLTVHHITFSAVVTSTNFSGDGSGIPVQVVSNGTNRIEGSGTTAIGGGVTLTVFDSASTHFTIAQQSATKVARSEDTTPT